MNRRIAHMALQAGKYVNEVYTPPVRSKTPGVIWEPGHVGWHQQFNAKFAELVIAECAAVVDSYWHLTGAQLKEHFGDEA